ncbi:MAG: DegV family protein [Candidatus Heimdallarchaeaceae archaeon]
MTVKILTDTAADLNLSGDRTLYDEYDVDYFPMHIIFGTDDYEELVDLKPSDFFQIIETSPHHPCTSQPSQFSMLNSYQKFGKEYDELISIHISSELSGSYKNAMFAKKMYEKSADNPAKVHIFDSKMASIPQGLQVIKAAKLAQKGLSADEIIAELEQFRDNDIQTFFTVEDLHWLFKGGRLSRTKYYVAKMMSLKPILTFYDGGLGVAKRVSNFEKATYLTFTMGLKHFKKDNIEDLTVHFVETIEPNVVKELANKIQQNHPKIKIGKMFVLGGTISAHVGPGTFATVITRNFEY